MVDILLYLTLSPIVILLLLLIIHSRQRSEGKILILFCLSVIGFLVVHLDKLDHHWSNYLFMTLDYGLPFSFYLLTKSLFDDRFQIKIWMPVMLVAIIALSFLVYFQIPNLDPNDELSLIFYSLFRKALALVFVILSIAEALKNRKDDLLEDRIRFRKFFILIIAALMGTTVIVEIALIDRSAPEFLEILQKGAILLLTYYLSVKLFTIRPGFLRITKVPPPTAVPTPDLDQSTIDRLTQLMESEKFFQTEGLSIRQVAVQLDIKEYKLRQVINQQLKFRNFNEFLNTYRIREACDLLSNPAHRQMTVVEIAYHVGYQSLAPFNKAFKELTKQTPTGWRKQHLGS